MSEFESPSPADTPTPASPPPHPFTSQPNTPRKSRSTLLVILGVALVAALAITAFWVFTPRENNTQNDGPAAAAEATTPSTPTDAPSTQPIAWPQNMRSGGLALSGAHGSNVLRSQALPENAQPQPLSSADLNGRHHIQLYFDYLCPYCSLFETSNSATLDALLASDSTVLELHPLTFLDKASNGSRYSSRTSGALMCVADNQPELAWKAHTALMSTEFQPEEGVTGPDNAAIAQQISSATGDLSDATQSCITNETYAVFAEALNNWVFSTTVPGAKDPQLTVSGTPFVVVDGVPYDGAPNDAKAFQSFLKKQGIALP